MGNSKKDEEWGKAKRERRKGIVITTRQPKEELAMPACKTQRNNERHSKGSQEKKLHRGKKWERERAGETTKEVGKLVI